MISISLMRWTRLLHRLMLYDQYLLDEAEKKRLKELHIAKSLQLSDKARPISVAISEVTPDDQRLLKEIEELHVKMQATTKKSSKVDLRAQIMEKQKLLSSQAQPAIAADTSNLIQQSDDQDKVLM